MQIVDNDPFQYYIGKGCLCQVFAEKDHIGQGADCAKRIAKRAEKSNNKKTHCALLTMKGDWITMQITASCLKVVEQWPKFWNILKEFGCRRSKTLCFRHVLIPELVDIKKMEAMQA